MLRPAIGLPIKIGASNLDSSSIIATAKFLSEKGLSVTPIYGVNAKVRNPGKQPVGADWQSKPSLKPEDIDEHFNQSHNLGIRTGAHGSIMGYYPYVIDVDVKDDTEESRNAALAFLDENIPNWRDMPRVKSGSGGASMHLYFFCKDDLPKRKIAKSAETFTWDKDDKVHNKWEIDLLGTGSQAILPPSIHPATGKKYRWEIPIDFDSFELMGEPHPIMTSEELSKISVDLAPAASDDEDDLTDLIFNQPVGLTLREMRKLLEKLDVQEWCDPRDNWIRTGLAIYHETRGSEEGRQLYHDWSSKSGKYDPDVTDEQWETFHADRTRGRSVTMRTIIKAARELKSNFAACWEKIRHSEDIDEIITAVAEYEINTTQERAVFQRIKKLSEDQYGEAPTAPQIRKEIANKRKEEEKVVGGMFPLERRLAECVLEKYYNGGRHLMRVDRNIWHFPNGRWEMISESVVKSKVQSTVMGILQTNDEGWIGALSDDLKASDRSDYLSALVSAVMNVVLNAVTSDEADPLLLAEHRNEAVMNCLNNELHFENGGLRQQRHDPDNRFTRQVQAIYDPQAECPLFDKAIREILGDEETVRHFLEQMGYIAQTSRNERMFMMLQGSGANGKSLLIQVITELLGSGSVVLRSIVDFSRNAHATASLVGKLMLVDDDYEKGAILPDGALKILSEGKMITANPKLKSEFEFRNSATPVILTNHWPVTRDNSFGMVSRAHVYEFKNRFDGENCDTHLLDKIIKDELPGVLNRLVEGFLRYQKRGGFLIPSSCKAAKSKWLSRRNSLAVFVRDIFGTESGAFTPRSEIWKLYQRWCRSEDIRVSHGRNNFLSEFEAILGFQYVKRRGVRGYPNLGINTESEFYREELATLGGFDDDEDDKLLDAVDELLG